MKHSMCCLSPAMFIEFLHQEICSSYLANCAVWMAGFLTSTRERLAPLKAVSLKRKRESQLPPHLPWFHSLLFHYSYKAAETCGINLLAQVAPHFVCTLSQSAVLEGASCRATHPPFGCIAVIRPAGATCSRRKFGAHQARCAPWWIRERNSRLHSHRSGHEWLLRFHCMIAPWRISCV